MMRSIPSISSLYWSRFSLVRILPRPVIQITIYGRRSDWSSEHLRISATCPLLKPSSTNGEAYTRDNHHVVLRPKAKTAD